MTEIDLNTNLPEVPEGQFWTVEFLDTSVLRKSWYGDTSKVNVPSLTVSLRETKTVGKWRKREVVSTVKSFTTPLVLNRIEYLSNFTSHGKFFPWVGGWQVLREDAYPELILALAHRVLDDVKKVEDSKNRAKVLDDAREALSGNYPPKKLPSV